MKATTHTQAVSSETFQAYKNDGCVRIPQVFTPEEVNRLTSICNQILSNWRQHIGPEETEKSIINFYYLTQPEFCKNEADKQFLLELAVDDRIKNILGGMGLQDPVFWNTQLFFTPNGFDRKGFWHRDDQLMGVSEEVESQMFGTNHVVHFHIPLIDDDLLYYIPGSHVRRDEAMENLVRYQKEGHLHDEPLEGERNYPAKAGDILTFSAHGIHKGKEYRAAVPRLTLDFVYAERSPQIAMMIDRDEKYPKETDTAHVSRNRDLYVPKS